MEKNKSNKFKLSLYRKYFPFIFTAIFLALSIALIYHHEFWRDEILSWHLGSESLSFNEFIANMSGDIGHPYLWFYILYLISHFITKNPESIKIIHLAISTTSVFLILKCAPLNKIIRVMMVFGYFFFYEYSIISRNYALGILFIIVFCILYKNKYKNLIPLSIALFLMGQVNIFSFMISIVLFLFLLFELIKDWKYVRKDVNKIYLSIAVLVVALEVLIIYWQLGSQFGSYSGSSVFHIFLNPISGYSDGVFYISRGIIGAYIPVPVIDINFFNTNFMVDAVFKGSFIPTFILALVLFLFPFAIIKKRFILLYMAASIGIMFIPFYIYKCSFRHFGHFFIIFIACLWLSNIDKDHDYLIRKKNEFFKKLQSIFLIIILSFSIIGSGAAFYYDWKYPFSNGKYVAEYIEDNFDEKEIFIVGYADYAVETVAGFLNKDIYYPNSKDIKKLVAWNNRVKAVSYKEVFSEASAFTDIKDKVLVIINRNRVPEAEVPYFFKLVDKEFSKAIIDSENYYLYLFNKKDFNLELIRAIDYSNFKDNWIPLNQCKFSIENKKVVLDMDGDDPWFESRFPIEFDDSHPLLLEISIKTPEKGELRIFYDRGCGEYVWDDSKGYQLIKGQNNVYIVIPYSKDLIKIRIDPIDKNQDCIIEKIELYSILE